MNDYQLRYHALKGWQKPLWQVYGCGVCQRDYDSYPEARACCLGHGYEVHRRFWKGEPYVAS